MHIPYSHYLACLCNIWSGSGCIVIVRAHVGFGDGHVLHLGNGVQGVQEGRICRAPLSQALCLLSCLLGHFDLYVLRQKSPHSAGLTSQYRQRGSMETDLPQPLPTILPGTRTKSVLPLHRWRCCQRCWLAALVFPNLREIILRLRFIGITQLYKEDKDNAESKQSTTIKKIFTSSSCDRYSLWRAALSRSACNGHYLETSLKI